MERIPKVSIKIKGSRNIQTRNKKVDVGKQRYRRKKNW